MNKKVIGIIVTFMFFSLIFNSVFSFQRDGLYVPTFPDGLIHLKGWVKYDINKFHPSSNNAVTAGIICKLKNTDKYGIHSLRLNNLKFNTANNLVYMLPHSTFNCNVGEILELRIALKEKNRVGIVARPVYKTIATFKVNNLFKGYIFPAPNEEISLSGNISPFLFFKWEFTNFNVKTRLYMSALSSPSLVLYPNGENIRINMKNLKPGKTYNILHHTLFKSRNNKFKFKKVVSSNSEVTFDNYYKQRFKTKSLILMPKLKSIK